MHFPNVSANQLLDRLADLLDGNGDKVCVCACGTLISRRAIRCKDCVDTYRKLYFKERDARR